MPFKVNGTVRNPKEIVELAFKRLMPLLKDFKASSLYNTAPMHYTAQDSFINAAVCGYYEGSPQKLLSQIQAIEKEFGRNRLKEIEKGPRTLDIDIELFGNQSIKTKNLTIPHEFLHIRPFVLVPLVEILPNSADPITREKFSDILKGLLTHDVIKID